MTNQTTPMCAYCGNEPATEGHHLYRRGSNPEMIDDPKNLVKLGRNCHQKTEDSEDFLHQLQAIFYDWKPINLDLFLKAQATIESIESGEGWDYYTPQKVDATLKLATAQFSHLNDKMTLLEQREAQYFGALLDVEKMTKSRMEIEWAVTEEGQEMIAVNRKIKVLEKIMSSMKTSLRRLEIERYNER